MKKSILLLLFSISFLLAGQAQIVITEIMYNPPESNVDSLEYIELYNNSNSGVNLENWSLFGVTFTFPAFTLDAHAYVVTAVNAAAIQNQFGVSAMQWAGGALSNGGETIAVINPLGDTIDKVTYAAVAPWPTQANGNGASLVLCDPNSDNSLPASWQAAITPTGVTINNKAIFANPGAASGCPSGVTAVIDNYIAVSGTLTKFNVLANDILPGQTAATVSIATNPKHGSAIVNADNTLSYTSTAGYCGSDTLAYQVCEGSDCGTAMVNITVRCYPQYTIDQINNVNADGVADSIGIYCELTATVYGVNLRPTGLQFTMIDDTNHGITVFNGTGSFGYTVQEKDKITVRGSINQFNGLIQIFPDTVFKVSGNNTLVTPLVVQNHSEDTESKLIRINNLRYVDAAQWATGVGTGFSVFMVSDDHPLDTIQVRIDNDVADLFNAPAPPVPFNLTGIGGQFDSASPFTSGYQIAPRYTADVSTLVGTTTVDFSSNVRLSPNPATGYILVRTDLSFDAIRVFSAAGQLVRVIPQPGLQEHIDLSAMAAGVYFIRFEKNDSVWITRFVKQ